MSDTDTNLSHRLPKWPSRFPELISLTLTTNELKATTCPLPNSITTLSLEWNEITSLSSIRHPIISPKSSTSLSPWEQYQDHHRRPQQHPRLPISANCPLSRSLPQPSLIMDLPKPPLNSIPRLNNSPPLKKPLIRPTTPPSSHCSRYILNERLQTHDS